MSADHFQPDSVQAVRYELQRVNRKFRILLWLLVGVIAGPFVVGGGAAILLPAIERAQARSAGMMALPNLTCTQWRLQLPKTWLKVIGTFAMFHTGFDDAQAITLIEESARDLPPESSVLDQVGIVLERMNDHPTVGIPREDRLSKVSKKPEIRHAVDGFWDRHPTSFK